MQSEKDDCRKKKVSAANKAKASFSKQMRQNSITSITKIITHRSVQLALKTPMLQMKQKMIMH